MPKISDRHYMREIPEIGTSCDVVYVEGKTILVTTTRLTNCVDCLKNLAKYKTRTTGKAAQKQLELLARGNKRASPCKNTEELSPG